MPHHQTKLTVKEHDVGRQAQLCWRYFGSLSLAACIVCRPQVSHGANGLSQERAYVTGLTAANLVIDKCGVGQKAVVLDVEPDEPHIAALKTVDQSVRGVFDALGIKSPLL